MILLSTILTFITICHVTVLIITVFGSTMITYEEMVKVKPQVKRPRPIMLVGEFSLLLQGKGIKSPVTGSS